MKEVIVTYNPDTAPSSNYEDGWPFAGGVLTINYPPHTNMGDHKDKVAAIKKNLESKL